MIAGNLGADTSENRTIAQGLLQHTLTQIAELREARRNDPQTAELIEFLEWLAQGLTKLVENLDQAIANPSEPIFLGTAGEIAGELKIDLLEAVKKNRVKISEVGAAVGTASFLWWLSGEKLTDLLGLLFK